jgi:tetratricopeptide (TPR) repeat protein
VVGLGARPTAGHGEGAQADPTELGAVPCRGNVQTIPHALTLLAEVYGQIGKPQKGLEALAEALGVLERTNERRREAEVHRLRGELLLVLPEPQVEDAEACFERALAVAGEQRQDVGAARRDQPCAPAS